MTVPYLIKMPVLSTELETVSSSVPDQDASVGGDGKNYPSSKDAAKKQREKIAEAIVANPRLQCVPLGP
jgi:hypothetical protein